MSDQPVAPPLCAALVAVAGEVLAQAGPHAVTVRRVAEAAATSTQAVYTCFGGKPGLVDALYREGFDRLARDLAAIPPVEDPLDRIRALGAVYRRNALADAHRYELMTGSPVAGYEPSPEARTAARAALAPLVDATRDAVDRGRLAGGPEAIAHLLWAAGHGFVALELHGLAPPDADSAYEAMTDALLAGHAPGRRD